LNINSIPQAQVILDGRAMGETPLMAIRVNPGRHTTVFIHPEYGRKVLTVEVARGQTKTVAVRIP
jgi:serine/threonine-protein kinase